MERVEQDQLGREDETRSDEGAFLFVGEILALDLVNTEIVVRGKRRDLLATPQDVFHWWQAVYRHHPAMDAVQGEDHQGPVYDRELLDELKTLRAALRGIFSAITKGILPPQEDVRVLNAVLKTAYPFLALTNEGNVQPVYRTHDTKKGEILLPPALSALHFIGEGDKKRLHQCDNEKCILLFYDTTKSATRRWCSLGCLERARSAQRYKAKRVQAEKPLFLSR